MAGVPERGSVTDGRRKHDDHTEDVQVADVARQSGYVGRYLWLRVTGRGDDDMGRSEVAKAKLSALDKIGEDELFEQLATGTSMRDLCKQHDVGHKLWYRWLEVRLDVVIDTMQR